MTAYALRPCARTLIWTLIFLLAMPPGMLMSSAFAVDTRRHNSFTRIAALETFRNPQISSNGGSRFMHAYSPKSLIGGGGESLANPGSRGAYGPRDLQNIWLTEEKKAVWSYSDLWTPGVGLDLVFTRTRRESLTTYDGPLGESWDFNWNKHLEEDGSTGDITFRDMGREEIYTESSGTYTSPAGRYDTLAKDTSPDPDEFTRTDKYGIVETYEQESDPATHYRLKSIEDLNGNTISFAYDDDSLLTKVTDTLSQDTALSYDANDRITKITDHSSREWVYAYDTGGDLTTVRTPTVDEAGTDDDYTSGKTTTYEYNPSDGTLRCIFYPKDPSGNPNWRIKTTYTSGRQWVGGKSMAFDYDGTNKNVTVTDRESDKIRYYFDSSGRITERDVYLDATNHEDTTFTYNSDHEVTEVIFPRDNEVEYTYDSDGNIVTLDFKKDASDGSPIRWVYTYTDNARLSTLTDPEGNTWDYDWDADGNMTKRTAPAVTVPSGIATSDKNSNSINDGTIVDDYEYNSLGQVTKWTDALGTDTEYEYTTVNSTSAYLHKIKRDTGVGNLNLVTQYDYDGMGNVTKVTTPEGNATTYTVNDLNQTIMVVEPLSVTKKWHYDPNDYITKTEASNDTDTGNSWYVVDLERDRLDNVTKRIEDLTASTRLTTTYEFDKSYRMTKQTSPEARVTETAYDVYDRVASVTRHAASAPNDAIIDYSYDANGNRLSVTDPRAYVSQSEYDLYDRLTKIIRPEGNYTTLAYDDNGNVTKRSSYNAGDTKLAETTSSYDSANRLYKTEQLAKKADLSTNLGDGLQSKTVWRDESGQVLEYTDDVCGCNNDTYVYDAVGRRVTVKDPMADQNLVVTEYDDDGLVTKRTLEDDSQDTGLEADKDIETTFVYDARDMLISKKEKIDGSTDAITQYFYGDRDQITRIIDPEGDETLLCHNEQLWKTKEVVVAVMDSPTNLETNDVVTEYAYDDDGLVVTYKAKNGTTGDQETVYDYDNLRRKVTTTWPDAGTTIQTYDKSSNRISTTDPMGTVTVCAYDDNNRLTAKDMTLATNVVGIDDIDYGYDGLDRLTQADAAEGVSFTANVDRTYNTLGKIESETQIIDGYNSGNGRTITYDWDVKGLKTGVTYPVSAQVVTYTRDDLDRADTITRGSTEVVDYAFSGKRVLKKAYPGSHALYTYDGYGRLTDVHHKDTSSGNTLAQLSYGWDLAHQVTHQDKLYYDDVENTRITDDVRDEGDQYAYDGAKRLVTVLRGVPTAKIGTAMATNITNNDYTDLVEYSYDQTGNRQTRQIDGSDDVTYAYNKVNEMTTEGGSSRAYTANGNYSGASNAYKYDSDNHLAEATVGADTYEWHYDALGRRVQLDDPNGDETRFYYDGIHCVEEVSWDGSTETQTKLFVYGEQIDELLEYVDISANPDDEYYAHADLLGSVHVLADETGAIAESYRYREFGVTTVVNSSWTKLTTNVSAVGNSYRYTGRRLDEVLSGGGLAEDWHYYRARHMHPDAGRFWQRDPLAYVDGGSLYPYASNRPTIGVDPTGGNIFFLLPTLDVLPRPSGNAFPGSPGNMGGPSFSRPAGPSVNTFEFSCPSVVIDDSPGFCRATILAAGTPNNDAAHWDTLFSSCGDPLTTCQRLLPPLVNGEKVYCGVNRGGSSVVVDGNACDHIVAEVDSYSWQCDCNGSFKRLPLAVCDPCEILTGEPGIPCLPNGDCQEFIF